MHILLVVPAVASDCSYISRMAQELGALGHDVRFAELPGQFPDADKAAVDAAHDLWATLEADRMPLIAGSVLPAFADLGPALGPRRAVALIDYPAALEPGLDEATRQRLLAAETAVMQATPRLVVTSQETADRLVALFHVDAEGVSVIAPGTEDLPRSAGSSAGGCAILSIGALIPRKGHDMLLQALSRLFDLDWHLTIVGAGADPNHAHTLRAMAEALKIAGRVRFAGTQDRAALEALWQGTDLFALASWLEGYGSATAEALRRGVPVAVTAAGAVPTLVGPEAGVVCACGEVDQLSKALRRMIFDAPLRRDMAGIAWQAGQALPFWPDQAARLADVLNG